MEISTHTKIADLIETYPFLLDFLSELNPKFKLLKNPIMRKTVGNIATITQAASIGGISPDELVQKINDRIALSDISETKPKSPHLIDNKEKQDALKQIILDLHAGKDFDEAKQRFSEVIKDINASEIAALEQQLMNEGMPETEVKRLCDVHVQVFKEALEEKENPVVPEGHPVHTFMLENRACEKMLDRIQTVLDNIGTPPKPEVYKQYTPNLTKLLDSLKKLDLHYLRKENQLFPVLEKHAITAPSQVMWSLDDDIRGMIKKANAFHKDGKIGELSSSFKDISKTIIDMIYKEEHILFPMAMDTLAPEEWNHVRNGENEIGYAWILPMNEIPDGEEPIQSISGTMSFETGHMTLEQANLLLTHLPLDISFVNEHDEVIYYSATRDRIFPRSSGVIGRKVQNCHPPKSLHIVQNILDQFKSGTKDTADFWITMNGKMIYIKYVALRDNNEEYKGCLEITQDITELQKITGEKRLLDW